MIQTKKQLKLEANVSQHVEIVKLISKMYLFIKDGDIDVQMLQEFLNIKI